MTCSNPPRYRVHEKGVLVREEASFESRKLRVLVAGTEVVVAEASRVVEAGKSRLRIIEPVAGWVSERCLALLDEEDYEALCERAASLVASGEGDAAFEAAAAAVEVRAEARALELRGRARRLRGDAKGAARDLASALEVCAASDRARLEGEAGERAAAERDAATLVRVSAACVKFGHRRCALADAEAAALLAPEWAEAQMSRGAALRALGDRNASRLAFVAAVRLARADAAVADEALRELGVEGGSSKALADAAYERGDHLAAVAAYSGLEQTDAGALAKRGSSLGNLGCSHAAERDAQRAAVARLEAASSQRVATYWACAEAARREGTPAARQAVVDALAELISEPRRERDTENFGKDAARPSTRVFAVSDVHFDHPGAREWASRLDGRAFRDDVLIVAGDLGDTLTAVALGLKALRAKFRRLFYCPGNHDLWIRPVDGETEAHPDSIAKLNALRALCDALDCETTPAQVARGLYVVPLLSWYDCAFDEMAPPSNARFDKFCKWPIRERDVADIFLLFNQHRLADLTFDGIVITFSHFLPRRELPYSMVIPGLAQAVGCTRLDLQIRAITPKPKVHIFGHSHMNCSTMIDGVRYVQHALGYQHEHGPDTPLLCVHDGENLVCSTTFATTT
ncbi:hypothetical protein CTAYLR_001279 [Chrysophaeum taylorii]|uniref:Calcineurin-like phosphoesterase domain-containing protein n=1 Tax=Chrysophaeum taylorii TaxID=2483200 RepID=A0AAD7UDI0_9STRA|nr:hypothetical protein CTAYLR_001279 [Chrysophaeum taylorii]